MAISDNPSQTEQINSHISHHRSATKTSPAPELLDRQAYLITQILRDYPRLKRPKLWDLLWFLYLQTSREKGTTDGEVFRYLKKKQRIRSERTGFRVRKLLNNHRDLADIISVRQTGSSRSEYFINPDYFRKLEEKYKAWQKTKRTTAEFSHNEPKLPRQEALRLLKSAFTRKQQQLFYPIWLKQNELFVNEHVTGLSWLVLRRTQAGQWTSPAQIGAQFSADKQYKIQADFKNHPELKTLIIPDENVHGHYWFSPVKLREFQEAYARYETRPDQKPLLKYLRFWLRAKGLFVNKRVYWISELLFNNTCLDCWTSPAEIAAMLREQKEKEINYYLQHDPALRIIIDRSDRRYGLSDKWWEGFPANFPDHLPDKLLRHYVRLCLSKLYEAWYQERRPDPIPQLRIAIITQVLKAALDGQLLTLPQLAAKLFNPKRYKIGDDLDNHPELRKIIVKDAQKPGRYWFKRQLLQEILAEFEQKSPF